MALQHSSKGNFTGSVQDINPWNRFKYYTFHTPVFWIIMDSFCWMHSSLVVHLQKWTGFSLAAMVACGLCGICNILVKEESSSGTSKQSVEKIKMQSSWILKCVMENIQMQREHSLADIAGFWMAVLYNGWALKLQKWGNYLYSLYCASLRYPHC